MRGYIVLVKLAAASFGNIRFIFEKEKREERKGCDKDMAPREGMYF